MQCFDVTIEAPNQPATNQSADGRESAERRRAQLVFPAPNTDRTAASPPYLPHLSSSSLSSLKIIASPRHSLNTLPPFLSPLPHSLPLTAIPCFHSLFLPPFHHFLTHSLPHFLFLIPQQ